MSHQIYHHVDDAKTKWCPFARVVWAKRKETGPGAWATTGDVAFNRAQIEFSNEEHPKGRCIVSDCMAWRWVETYSADENGGLTVKCGDQYGYCGLAGEPK